MKKGSDKKLGSRIKYKKIKYGNILKYAVIHKKVTM